MMHVNVRLGADVRPGEESIQIRTVELPVSPFSLEVGSVCRKKNVPSQGGELKSASEEDFVILTKPLQVEAFEPMVVFQTLGLPTAASLDFGKPTASGS